ncbi:Uncharacterised protein [Serratia plymuthica]|uniref:Uncharacterized protein n=1 Tax=Serratia plymuthica TaxID=82996 RepID=A0A2X4X285_SERPL|nr:Uncharacterised protein [Serratia plymuthica]
MAIDAFVHAVILLQPENAALRQLIANAFELIQAIDFPGQMVQPGRWFVFRRRFAVGAKYPGALLSEIFC